MHFPVPSSMIFSLIYFNRIIKYLVKILSVNNKFVNRMIMCFFAIVILWMTSLQVCSSIVNRFISTPNSANVYSSCNFFLEEASDQRALYKECAILELKKCSDDIETKYDEEISRISLNVVKNQELLALIKATTSTCQTNFVIAQNALNTYSSQDIKNIILYNNSCSTDQIKATDALITDSSQAISSMSSNTQQYTSASTLRVSRLANYAVALTTYNEQYVNNKTTNIRNKVKSLINQISLPYERYINQSFVSVRESLQSLLDCISLDEKSPSSCYLLNDEISMINLYTNLYDTMTNELSVLTDTLQVYETAYSTLVTEVTAATDAANDFFDATNTVTDWMESSLNKLGSSVSLCGRTSPDWCSFSKADWQVDPPSVPTLPQLLTMPTARDLWVEVQAAVPATSISINLASDQVSQLAAQWTRELEDAMTAAVFAPPDYHPPNYPYTQDGNVSEETVAQKLSSQSYESATTSLLNSLSSSSETTTIDLAVNSSILNSFTSPTSFSFSWVSFSSSDFSLRSWFLQNLSFAGLLLLLDYLYRVVRMFRLIRNHWNRSIVKLAAVDIRSDRAAATSLERKTWSEYVVPLIMGSQIAICILLLSMVILLVVWISLAFYIPFYQDYINGCVRSTASSNSNNGTFIGRNIYSFSYNFAATSGNDKITEGITSQNLKIERLCAYEQAATKTASEDMVSSIASAIQSHQSLVNDVSLLQLCLDTDALDNVWNTSCRSLAREAGNYTSSQCPLDVTASPQQPYPLLDSLLTAPACRGSSAVTSWTPLDQSFDCSVLPLCELTCNGPDVTVLKSSSDQCTCTAQWWLHSSVIRSLLVTLVYIGLNLSRVLFYHGILMTHWNYFVPNLFDYSATCNRSGAFVASSGGHSTSVCNAVMN